jgi:short-subunit dehydrogenase
MPSPSRNVATAPRPDGGRKGLGPWRGSARYHARLAAALRGKRVVLTGASSGIGRAFALQAGEAGADLTLVARRATALSDVVAQIERAGGTARAHAVDLGDPEAVGQLVSRLEAAGPVDVLIHNAGLSIRRALAETRSEDLERLIALDYLGAAVLTLGLLRSMRMRGTGHVVHVSTIGVLTGAPHFGGYVAAKAATDHFLRTLRLELGGQGIRVTQIAMPLVRTPMLAPSRIYRAFPALTVEKAARRIGEATIRQPVRMAPRWAIGLAVLETLVPGLLQWVFTRWHDPFHAWMKRRLARIEGKTDDASATRNAAPRKRRRVL